LRRSPLAFKYKLALLLSMTIYQIAEKIKQFTIYAFAILEAFLGLRLLMDFFGASKTAIFYVWIESATRAFYTPFSNLFQLIYLPFFKNSSLDLSLVFGMAIYGITAFFSVLLIDILKGKKIG